MTDAPEFAEGPGRPKDVIPGTWRPDPNAFAAFARAVATRYSGTFVEDGSALPRVRYYQAWTEPNLSNHLAPQYEGDQPVAPTLFRNLLNALYGAVKAVHPDNVVITAGTAPYGDDPPNANRTRPLTFWRDVLCLNAADHPLACPVKASFDALAHQPINTTGAPPSPRSTPTTPRSPTSGSCGRSSGPPRRRGRSRRPDAISSGRPRCGGRPIRPTRCRGSRHAFRPDGSSNPSTCSGSRAPES